MISTYGEQIEQIVQSIFLTMLNMDVAHVEDGASHEHKLVVAVHIAGEWVGAVVLSLSAQTARAAAAAMLEVSDDDVTDADEQEVGAELVNMIGGNLKSLLPGPSFLSMPTVVAGRAFGLRVHEAELIEDVSLVCDAGLFRVQVYAWKPKAQL
jgi:chemotaxis protein CheX